MGSYISRYWTPSQNLPKINEKAEYFFTKTTDKISDYSSPKEQISLNLSILKSLLESKYQVEFINSDIKVGTTEIREGNNSQLDFNMTFITDYFFEKQQNVIFNIYKDMKLYQVSTTIGNIMGSRGQVLVKPFNNEELVIRASTQKNADTSVNMTFQIQMLQNLNTNIFFFLKYSDGDNFITKYKSEIKRTEPTMTYDTIQIPSSLMGDFNNPLEIEILQYNNNDYQVLCGHIINLNRLLNQEKEVIINDLTGRPLIKLINHTTVTKNYTFLDYIRGGLQIALTIGIDFTASNKQPNEYSSLHYIGDHTPNSYEKAIRYCGDIVAYYDYDQLFPVYGFGAIVSGQVNHCFNLNLKEDPNINGIDEVLQFYRKNIPYLKFHGPTMFAPLIERVIKNVKNENNPNIYNILMILTDGVINDLNETIDVLVEASFLPISVIIIGIGYADFSGMEVLDADEQPLYDRHGRKAARDLVQFVPFYKYQNDGTLLAVQVLEEIPRQLVEYYKMNGIPPNDPIVDLVYL
jgi:hypothetical protein